MSAASRPSPIIRPLLLSITPAMTSLCSLIDCSPRFASGNHIPAPPLRKHAAIPRPYQRARPCTTSLISGASSPLSSRVPVTASMVSGEISQRVPTSQMRLSPSPDESPA